MNTRSLSLLLSVTVSLVGAASTVFAQPAPTANVLPAARPAPQAATVTGPIARYIVGPGGHIRGFTLRDGSVVMVHDGDALAQRIATGTTVRVNGFRAPNGSSIFHSTVQLPDGTPLVTAPERPQGMRDGMRSPGGPGGRNGHRGFFGHHGPHGDRPLDGQAQQQTPRTADPAWAQHRAERRARWQERYNSLTPQSATAQVQQVISGHRGPRMVLLSDGTTVFFPRGFGRALGDRTLRPGETVTAQGRGGAYPQGRSLIAESLRLSDGTVITPAPRPDAQPRS